MWHSSADQTPPSREGFGTIEVFLVVLSHHCRVHAQKSPFLFRTREVHRVLLRAIA